MKNLISVLSLVLLAVAVNATTAPAATTDTTTAPVVDATADSKKKAEVKDAKAEVKDAKAEVKEEAKK